MSNNLFLSIWQVWVCMSLIGTSPVGDMFKCKTQKIFKEWHNVFNIADDILIDGYNTDSENHNETL